MGNVAIVGLQWGDEGKGKIVDWLSERADVVVRFQGGHNAGHTLMIDDKVYKLSLLPSGVVRSGKLSCIGNGVVIDPWALFREIEGVSSLGVEITPDNLLISDSATLILPLHCELDQMREQNLGSSKIGTTGRGIGPAYEDKVGRRAIRVGDLADPEALSQRLERLLAHHDPLRFGLGLPALDADQIKESLLKIAPRLLSFAKPLPHLLHQFHEQRKVILFEGAQGVLLDVDHGSYPYVTSSNTVASQAATGSGLGDTRGTYVVGLLKAYTTRVGSGPFPTELNDEIGQHIGTKGREFGTVTGRARRCGWFDAVLARQSIRVSGAHGVALTKLDVLDGLETIKVCVGYQLNGQRLDYFPSSTGQQFQLEPIYEEIEGWSESTFGARSYADLPPQAVKYVRRLEELIGCPIDILSTSPQREDTILIRDPFSARW